MKETPQIEPCEVHTELDPYCSQCTHHMLYLIDKLKLDLKTAWFEKEILFDQVQELQKEIDFFTKERKRLQFDLQAFIFENEDLRSELKQNLSDQLEKLEREIDHFKVAANQLSQELERRRLSVSEFPTE